MILAMNAQPTHPNYSRQSVTLAESDSCGGSLGGFSVASGISIEEIRIGHTVYPLRSPTRAFYFPVRATALGKFLVEGFSPKFSGEGTSLVTARTDWEENVHLAFQRLYAMRNFEMTEADRENWTFLTERIDVDLYRNMTPLVGREIGKVISAESGRHRIRWVDGSPEVFTLGQVPGSFAAYKAGAWFEAQVVRDRQSGRLVEILSAQRITSLDGITPAEVDELQAQFPTTKELPSASL